MIISVVTNLQMIKVSENMSYFYNISELIKYAVKCVVLMYIGIAFASYDYYECMNFQQNDESANFTQPLQTDQSIVRGNQSHQLLRNNQRGDDDAGGSSNPNAHCQPITITPLQRRNSSDSHEFHLQRRNSSDLHEFNIPIGETGGDDVQRRSRHNSQVDDDDQRYRFQGVRPAYYEVSSMPIVRGLPPQGTIQYEDVQKIIAKENSKILETIKQLHSDHAKHFANASCRQIFFSLYTGLVFCLVIQIVVRYIVPTSRCS